MINNLEKINIEINVAQRKLLGPEWNTDKFFPSSRTVPYSRLFLPLSGKGEVKCNNHKYILEPGKFLLIPAFAQVYFSCDDYLEKYWCHFNAFVLNSRLDLFSFCDDCIELEINAQESIIYTYLFDRIIAGYADKISSGLDLFESVSALKVLLSPFLRSIPELAGHNSFQNMITLLSYIEQNLSKKISLPDLASHIGLHPNYMISVFKRRMGVTPINYLTRRRMHHALYLLHSSKLTVSEIAEKTGISSVQIFSKTFKRHYGKSPTDFRKEYNLT